MIEERVATLISTLGATDSERPLSAALTDGTSASKVADALVRATQVARSTQPESDRSQTLATALSVVIATPCAYYGASALLDFVGTGSGGLLEMIWLGPLLAVGSQLLRFVRKHRQRRLALIFLTELVRGGARIDAAIEASAQIVGLSAGQLADHVDRLFPDAIGADVRGLFILGEAPTSAPSAPELVSKWAPLAAATWVSLCFWSPYFSVFAEIP